MKRVEEVMGWFVPSIRNCSALLLFLTAFFLVSGCSSSAVREPVVTEFYPFSDEEREFRNLAKNAEYRIRIGDSFTVDFKYQDELDQKNVLVLPDGNITVSGPGVVPAAGFTVMQVDSILTTQYALDYVNPELSVIVNSIADQQVYVMGEVTKPGLVTLPNGGEGVLQAISVAGGFTKHARQNEILIARVTEEGFEYRICDLSHLEKIGIQQITYLDLQPYDIVYVPKSSLGNLAYFSETVLKSLVQVSDLFWDVYAITHLSKVDRLVR